MVLTRATPAPTEAEMPVAWFAWLAATVHAAAVILRRGPLRALDTKAPAQGISWRLAQTARRRPHRSLVPGRTPYRCDGG